MSSGVFVLIIPAILEIEKDVDIYYTYRPSRGETDENFKGFKKVENVSQWLASSNEIGKGVLNGLFNLKLPLDIFNKKGCKECNYSGYNGRALVAAIHVIDNDMKNKIKNIYNDTTILSNFEMMDNLNSLLKSGNISLEDYENFIEMEGINKRYEGES